jgi:hypothetical protein
VLHAGVSESEVVSWAEVIVRGVFNHATGSCEPAIAFQRIRCSANRALNGSECFPTYWATRPPTGLRGTPIARE